MNRPFQNLSLSNRLGRCLLGVWLLAAPGSTLWGQAVSNPNQIVGTIEFSNTNPDVLAILNGPDESPPGADRGFRQSPVGVRSLNTSPVLNNSTTAVPTSGTTATFEVTAESSPEGIDYRINAISMRMGGGGRYVFEGQDIPTLYPEPAPDSEVHFSECAGILEVNLVDSEGTPTTVTNASISVRRTSDNGTQAADNGFPTGASTETLAVRGDGSEYQVITSYTVTFGTDAYVDRLIYRGSCQALTTVQCDEIQAVTCEIPSGVGDLNADDLGEITGEIDMLGEEEHSISRGFTAIRAISGPHDNVRYDFIDATPSEGTFLLSNVLRSDFVSPARSYGVYGEMSFRFGNAYQFFLTPSLNGGQNPAVFVEGGMVTDLGDTFVMDPGFVNVDLQLAGPPVTTQGSCLEHIIRDADIDVDGDGIPNSTQISSRSHLRAVGLNELASGSAFTAGGGRARVGFEGSFDPSSESFLGSSQMVLAGLARERSIWQANALELWFEDIATPELPETYLRHRAEITNNTLSNLEIVPRETQSIQHDYCFSEIRVHFRSTSGTFYRPTLGGPGSLTIQDSQGNPIDYEVRINDAFGTPIQRNQASDQGMVTLCAPAADYTFTPYVTSINPGGGTSNTELPPVFVPCRCRQICDVTTEIQVSLNATPQCTTEDTLPIAGAVNSGAEVARVFYTNNSGSEVDLCTDCGLNPTFSAAVPLASCGNTVTVAAVDVDGNEASVASTVTRDNQPPTFAGCDPVAVTVPAGETGATVDFDITASDDCSGPVQVTCSTASGSFFPLGETQVTCTAGDLCGLSSQCSFPVTVSTEDDIESWHWGLDEGSGTVVGSSGQGDGGVLVGNPEWTTGQQGSALACGDGGFVLIDDSDTLDLDDLTVAAWIRPDALGGNQVLVSKDNTYEFEIGKLGDTVYDLRLNNIVVGQGNTSVKEGVWQHLAATWDGSTVRYYYNGQPDGSAPFAGPLAVNTADVGLCARPLDSIAGLPIFFFEGVLDEVRLYNATLSDAEILALVQTSLSDITAPVPAAGAPTGPLPNGTTEALISLTTDEDATCRYSTTAGTPFDAMTGNFATTGGTSHSTLVTGLVGGFHRFFVRCEDALGNRNAEDFEIAFGAEEIFVGAAGFWRFDGGSGCTAVDAWGNTDGNLGPACPTNAPTWTTGALAGGLSFATGQSVRVPHGPGFGPTSALTVAAWVKQPPATGYHSIADKRSGPSDGYDLYIHPSSKAFLRINLATLIGNTIVADGAWHHVVGVYDGSELRLYVDGVLDATSTAVGQVLDAESDLILGEHYSGTSAPLGGELDEVLVYDRALSGSEVGELYLALQ